MPRKFGAPTYLASDQTSITIQWQQPQDNGGCPIFDYGVFRDADGTGAVWTEVNPSSLFPRFDPFISTFQCETFPALTNVGSPFIFKVVAYNLQGSVTSTVSASILLASVPDKPAFPPTADPDLTNGYQIRVEYKVVPGNGGSPLLSYELQIGSLNLNDFVSVVGNDPQTLQLYFVITKGIVKGQSYALRYRAINSIGSGPWSD